ncbi:hypothetical protein FDG94_gp069 [Pseudomonas phage SM1]|uniref:Uncharacterized protein n=1 Tax=Pseudomonas phage SM1 TaxID=1772332 RepID=A0A0U3DEC1_9CAUD|nr:hypothetical protein FDG94_gp069 [Pseudomonas phage SM1]ALT58061.1 hypothetical protein SM1_069 [Pseudomonas phage SM1]
MPLEMTLIPVMRYETAWTLGDGAVVQFGPALEPMILLTEVSVGPPGPPGKDGNIDNLEAAISTDPGNNLALGSDSKLYTPDDIASDPLAYYILAKG